MSDTSQQNTLQGCFADAFAQLRDQEIEQFYAHYQLWVIQRRVPLLEDEIEALRTHIDENQQLMQALRPSAVAQAVLARLQANGVSDTELLDQMLERGEDWLDHTMQRLDYCEQVEDFIQGDYTQWCTHSLEGAYDWIDTVRDSTKQPWSGPIVEKAANESEAQATAELLLHKLSFDDEEAMQKAVPPAQSEGNAEESPTYQQALEILAPQDQIHNLSLETSPVVGEAEPLSSSEQTSASTQPAPWYSVNLNEDEPFDFERPGSMDDWISILQADITDIQETDVFASIDEQPTVSISRLPVASRAQEEPPNVTNEEASCLTPTSVVEISVIEPANQAVANEVEKDDAELVPSEITITIESAEVVLPDELAEVIEAPSVQDANRDQAADRLLVSDETRPATIAVAKPEHVEALPEASNATNEQPGYPQGPALPKKKVLQQAKKMLKHKHKAGRKATPQLILPTSKPETAQGTPAPTPEQTTQPCEQDSTQNTSPSSHIDSEHEQDHTQDAPVPSSEEHTLACDMSRELEQPTDLIEATNEIVSEDPQRHIDVEESAHLADEPEADADDERTITDEASQPTSAEECIIQAFFEPTEGQLPWYEYLAMEQTVSAEPPSANEIAEHYPHSEEPTMMLANSLDKTQPIALAEIQLARQPQATPQIAPSTSASTALAVKDRVASEQVHEAEAALDTYIRIDIEEIQASNGAAEEVDRREQTKTTPEVIEQAMTESAHLATEQVTLELPALSVLEQTTLELPSMSAQRQATLESPAIPVQTSPKKVGFWQWLWSMLRVRRA